MANETNLKVDAEKFDTVLRRLIEHKPVPKQQIKASGKRKLHKILESGR
jgi:hypothetical protein